MKTAQRGWSFWHFLNYFALKTSGHEETSLIYLLPRERGNSYILFFLFKEIYLSSNESTGVVVGGVSLHLTNLTNQQAGEYSCAARNTEGEARSTPVFVRVHRKSDKRTDLKQK